MNNGKDSSEKENPLSSSKQSKSAKVIATNLSHKLKTLQKQQNNLKQAKLINFNESANISRRNINLKTLKPESNVNQDISIFLPQK